jgi:UDP-N-acetylmuramate--alanine ligase
MIPPWLAHAPPWTGTILFDVSLADSHGAAAAPLATLPRAHLVGIAGAGMRSLAQVLQAAGWQISGSDLAPDALAGAPFDVRWGHDAAAIDPTIDLVVYTSAVSPANPELRRARDLGITTLSYPQMLGRLMQSRRGVAVAGTHGKSTVTAMTGQILTAAGLDPTVVVGAAPLGARSGGRFGQGPVLVAEACEYRGGFLHLKPEMAAILNIEPDHFDCFDTAADLQSAFARFVQALPADGLLVAAASAAVRRACADVACDVETFALAGEVAWRAAELDERRGYYGFQIRCRELAVCDVKLPVPGRHNVLNALAAAALASHLGASGASIREGLEQFVALRRRLQLLGEVRDVALVDDYAHHPTEVAATLATLRRMYPERRLWCVFQPHQSSRLARLLDEFALSLQNADRVVLADVFCARESPGGNDSATAADLACRLSALGQQVVQLASAGEIRDYLRAALRGGDVVVTMGAGDIGTVAHELGKGLRTFRKTP